jgi:hypothetical protein
VAAIPLVAVGERLLPEPEPGSRWYFCCSHSASSWFCSCCGWPSSLRTETGHHLMRHSLKDMAFPGGSLGTSNRWSLIAPRSSTGARRQPFRLDCRAPPKTSACG